MKESERVSGPDREVEPRRIERCRDGGWKRGDRDFRSTATARFKGDVATVLRTVPYVREFTLNAFVLRSLRP